MTPFYKRVMGGNYFTVVSDSQIFLSRFQKGNHVRPLWPGLAAVAKQNSFPKVQGVVATAAFVRN